MAMNIKLTSKEPLDLEGQQYLEKCEKILNHKFEHISEEELVQRMMIWGTYAMKEDENGQYRFIEIEDLVI